MEFKINDIVKELPDNNGESRWSGKVVAFVQDSNLLIVSLDKGFFSDTPNQTPIYISLMVVHPSNCIL